MDAWYAKELNPSGKRPLVFSPNEALQPDEVIQIPCRKCLGCRIQKSKEWAIRCMHEHQMHEEGSFITLTFNEESLHARENPWSLDHQDFQKFAKRLRKYIWSNIVPCHIKQKIMLNNELLKTEPKVTNKCINMQNRVKELIKPYKLKYYMCGEYGEENARPHYHAILFGIDFSDKELWKIVNGQRIYVSAVLQKLWPYGFSTIGSVTFESAAYVSRYIMKKQYGDIAEEHYTCIDQETGEIIPKKPEYQASSNRKAIGRTWFEKYWQEAYPKDYVTFQGRKFGLPKYYDKLLKEKDEDIYDEVINNRYLHSQKQEVDKTYERLLVREQVLHNKLDKLVRDL